MLEGKTLTLFEVVQTLYMNFHCLVHTDPFIMPIVTWMNQINHVGKWTLLQVAGSCATSVSDFKAQ